MARDLPNVGISYAPQVKANSDWYLNLIAKSNVNNPADTTVTSLGTNITSRAYSFTTRRGRTYELGRIESGECQLAVDNTDGLFDPNNSTSPFYPDVLPYRPVAINCAYPLTGNILNDTNLKPAIPSTAPSTYGDSRVSVGENDSNFELGSISNWYLLNYPAPGALDVVSGISVSGTYSLVFNFFLYNPDHLCLDVPVVSGKQITVSLYFRGAAGNNLVIRDGGAYGSILSTQAMVSASSFTQYKTTVTPQTNKITISIEGANNGGYNYVDNVQVEFGATVSTYNTNGPTIYSLFNGFIERYPQTYQAPNRGQVNMIATDAIASMSQNILTNLYEALILQDTSTAVYYYTLGESSGSTSAYNSGLYNQQPLVPFTYGTAVVPVFGDSTSVTGVPGSGNTCVQLTYDNSNGGTLLSNSYVNDISMQANNSYTFSFWFNYTSPITSGEGQYWIFQAYTGVNVGAASIYPTFKIYVDSNGLYATLSQNDKSSVSNIINATTAVPITADGWNFVSVNLSWTGTTYTLSINNVTLDGTLHTQTASGASTVPVEFSSILLEGMSANHNYKVSNFTVNRGAINIAKYASVGRLALYGESTGNRFKDIVNTYSGMKYLPYQSDYGKSFMQSASTEGNTLADYVQNIADNENGTWYVDGAGYATFKDRWNRLQKLVPKAVFGDLPIIVTTGTGASGQNKITVSSATNITAGQLVSGTGVVVGSYVTNVAGTIITVSQNLYATLSGSNNVTFNENAYDGSNLLINYDQTYVLNDINVKQTGGTLISVQDQKSVANYYPRTYTRTLNTLTDSDASDAAFYLLSKYKDPHARPETLTLTPARTPALWPVVLGLEIGDLIRVNKRPLGATALSIDCFVERVEHSFDAQTADWITHVTLSPTILYYWNAAALRATTTGAAVAGSYVFTKGTTTTGGLVSPRDLIAGQMLQYTSSGTTYVDVVIGGITESSTTVTVPVLRVGSFTKGSNSLTINTLASDVHMDSLSSIVLSKNVIGVGTATKILIDTEIIDGNFPGGYNFVVTGRASNGTLQTASGSSSTYTASHLAGASVYGVDTSTTLGGNVPSGTLITEYLPNQTTEVPYSVPLYQNYDLASTLGSWNNTLQSGTVTVTTPASGIKYGAFTVSALTDKDNYPSSDIAIGQIISAYNNTSVESLAVIATSVPSSTDGSWTLTGYKITDSTRTLSAAVTPDGTTITCSGAVTASAILIGNEFMQVTAGSGTTSLTVVRGTPDAAVWNVFTKSTHYQYDKIYTVVNAGFVNTYVTGNSVIEGYNVNTPIIGTARLGY